jgi:hypothetical protein
MNLYWIWCDIDGSGKRWRLVADRGTTLYFVAEDFEEEGGIDDYREDRPGTPIDPCPPPKRDPRIKVGVHRPPDGKPRPSWRLVSNCSACYAEGSTWSEPGTEPDSGWSTLREGLRAQGWLVLEGDDRPYVQRGRHARSTRMICPECVAELRAALG